MAGGMASARAPASAARTRLVAAITRLEERGAKHVSAPEFTACVARDGRLVTDQNPASATGVAEQMLIALAGTPAGSTARETTESYLDAENRRDLEAILTHFADDVRFVTPEGVVLTGREGIRPFYAADAAALPTLSVELVDHLADGDRAAVEWRAEATTAGGEPVRMHGTNVVTLRAGRFSRFDAYRCQTRDATG